MYTLGIQLKRNEKIDNDVCFLTLLPVNQKLSGNILFTYGLCVYICILPLLQSADSNSFVSKFLDLQNNRSDSI